MAFRDDRDAQLARAEALDRENRRLREELAERERALAEAESDDDAVARDNRRLREALEKQEKRERELREKLALERGPGLLVRIGSRIASLRLPEPTGQDGYWRAALSTWRLYAPIALAGALPTIAIGGTTAYALAAAAIGTPILAALFAAIPWVLRRRRHANAGAACGTAIGLFASAVCLLPNVVAVYEGPGVTGDTIWPPALAVYLMVMLLWLFRALPRMEPSTLLFCLPWLIFMLLPHPLHLAAVFVFALFGLRLADPTAWCDD